jgi:hypothetical protein
MGRVNVLLTSARVGGDRLALRFIPEKEPTVPTVLEAEWAPEQV